MKRQHILLIALGSVFVLLCLGMGYFLFSAISEKNKAEEERLSSFEQLRSIYHGKVFPSVTNILQVKNDEKNVREWLGTASNLLHKGEFEMEGQTPSGFKQKLQDTVRKLSAHPGQNAGKIVGPNFYFGFDKYLGESSSLPADTNIATRLAYQLAVIEKICNELYGAGILELRGVTREMFDDAAAAAPAAEEAGQPREERRSKRRNRRGGEEQAASSSAVEQQAASAGLPDFAKKQSFSFEFIARPDGFIKAVNKVSCMDPFAVLSKVEFQSAADSLAAYMQSMHAGDQPAGQPGTAGAKNAAEPSPLEKAAAAAAPAEPKRIIVTSPDLEPPLVIKFNVDVYSFEGV